MNFLDKDVKLVSNPKKYGEKIAGMRKKNRNRCSRLLKEAYKRRAKK